MGKILEKSGNFVSPEKWQPCMHLQYLVKIERISEEKRLLRAAAIESF